MLSGSDRLELEELCWEFAEHPDAAVRGTAGLCNGHIGRRFGLVERRSWTLVDVLSADDTVDNRPCDALGDLRYFAGASAPKGVVKPGLGSTETLVCVKLQPASDLDVRDGSTVAEGVGPRGMRPAEPPRAEAARGSDGTRRLDSLRELGEAIGEFTCGACPDGRHRRPLSPRSAAQSAWVALAPKPGPGRSSSQSPAGRLGAPPFAQCR